MSAEPSMEDILSSIKRIISEEGDGGPPPSRPRRPAPKAASLVKTVVIAPPTSRADGDEPQEDADAADEVLELSNPMPDSAGAKPADPTPKNRDAIVSSQAAQATRGALDTLSRLLVRPEPESDGTLEGLVRDMLRPMLREWIDTNLPPMVEKLVAREISRITSEPR